MARSIIRRLLIALPIAILLAASAKVPDRASAQIKSDKTSPIKPAVDVVLSIDDGNSAIGIGGSGNPGFGWFNLLVPDAYPATLKEVLIAFNSGSRGMQPGSPIKVLIFVDPEADGLNDFQKPDVV